MQSTLLFIVASLSECRWVLPAGKISCYALLGGELHRLYPIARLELEYCPTSTSSATFLFFCRLRYFLVDNQLQPKTRRNCKCNRLERHAVTRGTNRGQPCDLVVPKETFLGSTKFQSPAPRELCCHVVKTRCPVSMGNCFQHELFQSSVCGLIGQDC